MSTRKGFLMIILFFTVALLASCKSQQEAATEEIKRISRNIEVLDDAVRGNIQLTQKLKIHESRLSAAQMNPKRYRIPLFIEGRSIYTSADESEIDEISYSLAFEDLLEMHHPGKGKFKSDDPAVWKVLLMEHRQEALGHLSNVELPAIQRRLKEIEKENIALESKKGTLLEKIRTLQGKVVMLPEYHAVLNSESGRAMPGR